MLSKTEQISLDKFFHAIMWGSQAGYVLYGDKPICVEAYSKDPTSGIFNVGHHLQASISEGIGIWSKLQLPFDSSKFTMINQSFENDRSLILFINKKALGQVFHKNAALFRYVLGPELTVDKLLDEFKHKDFFSALKNDNVLIGLLLGFGIENSLYVGRLEEISDEIYSYGLHSYKKLNKSPYHLFFFKTQKVTPPFKTFSLQPSFGYSSLAQEWDTISSKIEFASDSLEKYDPKLIFGKVSNRLENDVFIKKYENTQLKILEILSHTDWLQRVLSQFYNEAINIKVIEHSSEEEPTFENLNSPKIAAQIIFYNFSEEFERKNPKKLEEFIAGIREAETRADAHYIAPFPEFLEEQYPFKDRAFLIGFKTWSFYKFNGRLLVLDSVIRELINISKDDADLDLSNLLKAMPEVQWQFFKKMDAHEKSLAHSQFQNFEKTSSSDIKCLAKDRVYYQQIIPGNGAQLFKDQLIRISYTLKTIYGNIIEEQADTILDLSRTIKAFRTSFPSMKVGEQGVLFIYPEWGIKDYLSPPYFSPYLIAEFEILG